MPVAMCFWLFAWPGVRFQWSRQLYPTAQKVSSAYAYYGANSGLRVEYYWTQDDIAKVRDHYDRLSLPFVGNATIFQPYGNVLEAFDVVGNPIDVSASRQCHYTQKYSCIRVALVDFGAADSVSLPDAELPISSQKSTQTPLQTPLEGGTLIIYEYYVPDW